MDGFEEILLNSSVLSNNKIGSIHILVHNVYQIPCFFTKIYKHFTDKPEILKCKDRLIRANRLIDMILKRGYDLCLLQEMWGENTDLISNKLVNYEIPKMYRSINYVPACFASFFNSVKNMYDKNGGLFLCHKPVLERLWHGHYTFKNCEGEELYNKSFSITLFNATEVWDGKYLIVGNVHNYSSHPLKTCEIRKMQREEMIEFMNHCYYKITDFMNWGKSDDDPTLSQYLSIDISPTLYAAKEWKNVGVILGGDFNFGVESDARTLSQEYMEVLKIFDAVDLFRDNKIYDNGNDFSYDPLQNYYAADENMTHTSTMDYLLNLKKFGLADDLLHFNAISKMIKPEYKHETSDHYALDIELFLL